MAPEQARGAWATVDERADVFGLGSILCEILTGQPVYASASGAKSCRKWPSAATWRMRSTRLDGCGADCRAGGAGAAVRGGGTQGSAARRRRDRHRAFGLHGRRARAAQDCRGGAGAGRGPGRRRAEASAARDWAGGLGALDRGARRRWAGRGWLVTGRLARERTTRTVNEALHAAALKLGQARSDPGEPTVWVEAFEAASRAAGPAAGVSWQSGSSRPSQLAGGDGHAGTQPCRPGAEETGERSNALPRSITTWACTSTANGPTPSTPRPFATTASTSMRSSPPKPVDCWRRARLRSSWRTPLTSGPSFAGRRRRATFPGRKRLSAVARVADPDPWRTRLRETLDVMVTDRSRALEGSVAAGRDGRCRPASRGQRHEAGLRAVVARQSRDGRSRFYGVAQRAHPDDFWLNMDLGRELSMTGAARRSGPILLGGGGDSAQEQPGARQPGDVARERSGRFEDARRDVSPGHTVAAGRASPAHQARCTVARSG